MERNRFSCLIMALLFVATGYRRNPPLNPDTLHRAAEAGNLEWVQKLILSCVEKNVPDDCGRTPLCWFVVRNCINGAKLLLAYGADVAVVDRRGQTPLAKAAQRRFKEVVELLRGQESRK